LRRPRSVVALLALLIVACQGADTPVAAPPGVGAETPVEAVNELVELLNIPDFDSASDLAYPGQAALASLAEGATFGEVASALEAGDGDIAANFWAGFAQGTGSFLTGEVAATPGDVEVEDGVEFHQVVVVPPSGDERLMLTRDVDGHRIDIFASFGGGLATQMVAPVERLLSTETDDARRILDALRATVPSLLVAASQEDLSPEASQALTRLVELITRSA
jgi:hypothetical protein